MGGNGYSRRPSPITFPHPHLYCDLSASNNIFAHHRLFQAPLTVFVLTWFLIGFQYISFCLLYNSFSCLTFPACLSSRLPGLAFQYRQLAQVEFVNKI